MRARRGDDFDDHEAAIARFGAVALDNPVATGGVLVMVLTATLIAANALSFQPGKHPAPLFVSVASERASVPLPPRAPAQSPLQAANRSDLVHEVQVSLRRAGYYTGALDGVSGPMTDQAVRAYERASGLPETGEITHSLLAHMLLNPGTGARAPKAGSQAERSTVPLPQASPMAATPVTTSSVRSPYAPPERIPAAASTAGEPARETVRAVQQALADLGYGPITIDGVSGAETASAIRRFELDRGMAITGKVRPEIYASLEKTAGVKIPR